MKRASFRPQVVMLEGRLQPGSILGSPMLSDGLGIIDHGLQTGFEDVARQKTMPQLISTESASQLSTPAQPVDNGIPVITNPLTQTAQILPAPEAQDSQVESLQNILPRSGKVPLQLDPPKHQSGTTTPGNLVCDGDFESGLAFQSPTSETNSCWWSQDTSKESFNRLGFAHTGNWSALLGPIGNINAKIAQIIPTVGGRNYVLSFWLRNDGGTPNFMHVNFDGVQVFAIDNGGADSAYVQHTINVTGSHFEAGLEFYSRQDPAFWHLDDVSLTPV